MRRLAILALAALALLCAGALGAAQAAQAAFGFKDFDVTFTEEDGSTDARAGTHPFAMTTTLAVNTAVNGEGKELPEEEAKNLFLTQVPGFAGNPTATPRCGTADFVNRVDGRASCPDSTAVGVASIKAAFQPIPAGAEGALHVPVYNLVPPPGMAAKLGFVALNEPITVEVGLSQTPPYNIEATLQNIPQVVLFYGSRLTLWGNPADPAHDTMRGKCVGEPLTTTLEPVSLGSCPVNVPKQPFLTLPRACEGPLASVLWADSWQDPGLLTEPLPALTHGDSVPPSPLGMQVCEALGFEPTIAARPTSAAAESASGIDFTVEVDDEELTNPDGTADSDIEKIVATLPAGVTANPSAAEGLGVCTPGQYAQASLSAGGCPEASKLGSLEVETPLLENHTLHGSVYLAQQDDPATPQPGAENPFDSLLALYLVIRDPELGILVKQPAEIEPNPQSGRLVTRVEGIPQVPLSRVSLHLREGPRSPLITPPTCGTYTTTAVLTPWSGGAPVEATSSFTITSGPGGGPCPAAGVPPFSPGFEAGSLSNSAGRYSPFYMRLTRQDGEQDMTRFDSILPPGVTGKIAGLAQCPQAAVETAKAKSGRSELAAPSCPDSSRIGRTLSGAGVGSALTYVPGSLYLGGPYNGDPLSVVAIVPAVAGPLDVGTVVVQEALNLNPDTAEVEVDGAASDPIPHILKGIPLKLRDLRVYVDRPGFTLNPTSCEPLAARATLFGGFADVLSPADDVPVALSSRYQAADCASLPFKPKLTLSLRGGTKRSANTALRAVLNARGGDANVEGAEVILPPSQFIDNAHINNPCTRVQFAAGACPKSSILGRARAITPLLDAPLEGPVYFRSNGGERSLPDIVADLHGQFRFILVIGILESKSGRVRTKVLNAPDAPVSKFVLNMAGGKKGLLENSENLCAKKQRATLNLTGQNGRRYKTSRAIKTSCGKKGKRSKRHRRR